MPSKVFMNILKGLLSTGELRDLFLKISPLRPGQPVRDSGQDDRLFLSTNYLISTITSITNNSTTLKQEKLPNDNDTILNYFFSIGKRHRAVVESNSNCYRLSDPLNDHGIEIILAHAKYLKAISLSIQSEFCSIKIFNFNDTISNQKGTIIT
jgi:hypothetical protein